MMKSLFEKYLWGRCSEAEWQKMASWFKEEAHHESSREMIYEVWDGFNAGLEKKQGTKYNQILDKIHHQINIENKKQTSKKSRVINLLSRAAVILFIPMLALLVYTNLPSDNYLAGSFRNIEVEAPMGSKTFVELADGTKVWLNHNSKIKYPYRFNGNIRKVELEGEAYFEVAHNDKIPFVVETSHIEVMATGTEFNVMAYPEDKIIETTLISGGVTVYSKKSSREIKSLSPNERLKFNTQTSLSSSELDDTEKYVSWKDGKLIFKNDPIEDIAKRLSRWYNVEIIFTNESVKEYTYTATFADETLPQILELMEMAAPITYEYTKRKRLPDGTYSKRKVLINLK